MSVSTTASKNAAAQRIGRVVSSDSIASPRSPSRGKTAASSSNLSVASHEDDQGLSRNVSFLSADTVRWMNKRKPNAKNSLRAFVMPARALQLREIFRGLDFDRSGNIDIDELKEAISYVVTASTGDSKAEPLFKDPQKIMHFFTAMDTNGDGTVDFDEFLLAMTSQSEEEESNEQTKRLQNAFFDFANKHRRQKIRDFVSDPNQSDLVKYEEMKNLFSIKYFKKEAVITSVSEQLNQVREEVKKQMKEIQSEQYLKQKKLETKRAREASLYFEHKRKSGELGKIGETYTPSIMSSTSNSELAQSISEAALHRKRAERNIRKRFSEFSLNDFHTFTPDQGLEERMRPENVRRMAKLEAYNLKQDKYLTSNLPEIKPPVSMKTRILAPIEHKAHKKHHH